MPGPKRLTFTVDLWSEDRQSIAERVAIAATLTIGRAAFDAAAITYPDRMVTLTGPGCLEVHAPDSEGKPSYAQVA